jgi:hypothetical protein
VEQGRRAQAPYLWYLDSLGWILAKLVFAVAVLSPALQVTQISALGLLVAVGLEPSQ